MQEMTAELSRLKIEKVALEERNKLLEKVLSFKQQGQAQPGQGPAKGQLVSFRRHSAACVATQGGRPQLGQAQPKGQLHGKEAQGAALPQCVRSQSLLPACCVAV